MSDNLKEKQISFIYTQTSNQQVASCTLDASTKIYAYRVDSIHTDTLKMAGGLGRTQDKEKNREDEEDAAGEEGLDGEKKKRKVIDSFSPERSPCSIYDYFNFFFFFFTLRYNHVISGLDNHKYCIYEGYHELNPNNLIFPDQKESCNRN